MRRLTSLLCTAAALALAGCGASDKTHGGAEATATPEGGASPAPVVDPSS